MAASTQKTFANVSSGSPEYTDSINVGENGNVELLVEPGATLTGQSPPAYNATLQVSVGGVWADVSNITSASRDVDGNPLNVRINTRLPTGAAVRGEMGSASRGSSTIHLTA